MTHLSVKSTALVCCYCSCFVAGFRYGDTRTGPDEGARAVRAADRTG